MALGADANESKRESSNCTPRWSSVELNREWLPILALNALLSVPFDRTCAGTMTIMVPHDEPGGNSFFLAGEVPS